MTEENNNQQPYFYYLLADLHLQPASLASVLLCEERQDRKIDPDEGLSFLIQPCKSEMARIKLIELEYIHEQGRYTVKNKERSEERYHFWGSQIEINDVMRYTICETNTSYFYNNQIDRKFLSDVLSNFPRQYAASWQFPAMTTTNRIHMPYNYEFEKDDSDNKTGPSFDYYRQDWEKELLRTKRTIERQGKKQNVEFAMCIVEDLIGFQLGTVYPAMFMTERAVSTYNEHGGIIAAVDPVLNKEFDRALGGEYPKNFISHTSCIIEPYHRVPIYTTSELTYVMGAQKILEKTFINRRVQESNAQRNLQKFNELHYSLCAAPGENIISGKNIADKITTYDFFMRYSSLS